MLHIYHNPRCSKSRAGLKYLESKTSDFKIIKYLTEEPFTKSSLTRIVTKLNNPVEDIIRTQENIYKKQYKGKNLSKDEWITTLVNNPRLIARPLVEGNKKAVLGNPPENIDELI